MGATVGKFPCDKEIGMRCRRGGVALCLIAFIACGRGSRGASSDTTVDTLPNGTVVVHNSALGLWDSASAWRIEPNLRVGRAEGNGPDVFGAIATIAEGRAGRIYVVESQAQEVRVFDSVGAYVRTIGRKGGGPGEFQGAMGLAFDPAGRLWVIDGQADRLSVFDTSGTLLATHRREGFGPLQDWIGGFTTRGMLYDETMLPSEEITDGGARRAGRVVHAMVLYDTSGTPRDTLTLPTFVAKDFPPISMATGTAHVTFGFAVPFAPSLSIAFDPRGAIRAGVSGSYAIVTIGVRGDTTMEITRAYTPLPITLTERDSALGPIRAAMDRAGMSLDPSLVPEVHPAFTRLIVDDAGYLWVATPVAEGSATRALDVFQPDGRYLGVVHLPIAADIATLRISGDRTYWVTYDSLDVPYVARGRILGR